MSTYVSDTDFIRQQAEELSSLREQLRQERERRVMTALWGSRNEDCPRPFSLYRPEDAAEAEGLTPGILGYGCTFADGFTVVQRTDIDGAPQLEGWITAGELEKDMSTRGVRLVWLAEDLDDFTAAVTDAVENNFKARAREDSVRITVHHAVCEAVEGALTWADCGRVADKVLTALFGRIDA